MNGAARIAADGEWAAALAVAAGGAVGALARYGVVRLNAAFFEGGAWIATAFVNASGSFAMGVVASILFDRAPNDPWRAFLAIGALGAFTTFSTFSLDAFTLWRDRGALAAGLYAAGGVVSAFAAFAAGAALARFVR
ncbi:MAG: CrcB family protein [Parvularculaceae bacterium]